MKKSYLMGIALLAIVLLSVIGCSNEPKIKTVLNPADAEDRNAFDPKDLYDGMVDKVILTDSMTIMDFSCEIPDWVSDEGGISFLCISPKTYIIANGKKYYIIGSKNIPIGNSVQSEAIRYRTVTYSLIFPPIPFDTDTIGFYEECDGYTAHIRGIDLTGKAETIAYKDKKDSEIYTQKIKAILEEEEAAERRLIEENQRIREESQKPYRCKYCGKRFYHEYEKSDCEMIHGLKGMAGLLN